MRYENINLSHFENGREVITHLYSTPMYRPHHFFTHAIILLWTEESKCISVLPNIKYTVTSHSFSKFSHGVPLSASGLMLK